MNSPPEADELIQQPAKLSAIFRTAGMIRPEPLSVVHLSGRNRGAAPRADAGTRASHAVSDIYGERSGRQIND
jgi:hypothetical protein